MLLLNYLGYASLFLACFYVFYRIFFRKEVFHELNRVLLLLIMAATLSLPLLPAPDWFHPVAGPVADGANGGFLGTLAPVVQAPSISVEDSQGRSSAFAAEAKERGWALSLAWWLTLAYFIGLSLLAGRLFYQFVITLRLLSRGDWKRAERGWLVQSDEFGAPFSFWNVIFLPSKYAASPLRSYILEHESAHQRQWHSADLLLAELFCLLFWFHPAAWRLGRALREQLEYLADKSVLNSGVDRKSYQYSLLTLACSGKQFRLANQFNQSRIKNRIVMMNAKKSPAHHKLKYLMVFPLALLLVLSFNDVHAQSEEARPAEATVQTGLGEDQSETPAKIARKGLVASGKGSASVSQAGGPANGGVSVGLASSSSAGAGKATGTGLSQSPYESVFVAIGAEFPVERLPQMKKDLEEQGILLHIEELDYNSEKLITRLKLSVRTTDGKMHGNGYSYNDGEPIDEPVIFYVRRDEGKYGFGIFTGKMNDDVPADVRNVIERMENGYFVGKIITE